MSLTRIQLRRGTESQWASSSDAILASGEIGFETDTNNFKIGNGETPWAELPYFKNVDELNSLSDNNLSSYARVSQLSSYIQNNKIGAINGVASLDSSGQIPTSQLQNIIDGAPATLDTLKEIADILAEQGDVDAILEEIGTKVSKTGDTISGDLIVQNSASPGTDVGQVTANRLRLLSTGESDLTSTTHALQIGADNSTKLKIDQNEIQAVDAANAANVLQIQPHGGTTIFGGNVNINSNTGVVSIGVGLQGRLQVGSNGIQTTGELTAKTITGSVASTTSALDFATETFKTISITGTTTFTASNYAAGRTITVRLTTGLAGQTIGFPAGWVFVGTRPTAIANNKTGILTITSFGTTEAACVAAWAVQP
jgi:hypothetical protein